MKAPPTAGAVDLAAHRMKWRAYWDWCLFDPLGFGDPWRTPESLRSVQHGQALRVTAQFTELRRCIDAARDAIARGRPHALRYLDRLPVLFDVAAESAALMSATQEAELSYLRHLVWGTPVGDGPMTYREPPDEPPAGVDRGQ